MKNKNEIKLIELIENGNNKELLKLDNSNRFVIPEGTKKIGAEAFSNFKNLEEVIIPESVEEIEYSAFYNCEKLKNITLPTKLKEIEDEVFFGCASLVSIVVPSDVNYIGNYAFGNCSSLVEVELNEGLTTIYEWAFSGCCSLKKINLPLSLTRINSDAFSGCEKLEEITLPEGLLYLENSAFSECTSLKEITIPEGIKEISSFLFYDCKNLEKVIIPSSVTVIKESAFFNCTKLSSIKLPDELIEIKDFAFAFCINLREINIPKNVQFISEASFKGDYNLNKITISNENKYYEDNGSNAIIEASTKELICISSESLIPNMVEIIGPYAYYNNLHLKEILIPESVKNIIDNPFEGCYNLEKIEVDKNNRKYTSKENANAIIEIRSHKLIIGCKNTIIPSDVLIIGVYAFKNIKTLIKIDFPNGLDEIQYEAFTGCTNLKEVVIPKTVSYIEQNVFSHDEKIERIVVEEGSQDYSSMGSNVIFELKTNTLVTGCVASIVPNNTLIIGEEAFIDVPLKEITISRGLKEIKDSAFYNCQLKSIYLPISVESCGSDVFAHNDDLVIYLEHKKKPIKFQTYWNSDNYPVIYGYKIKRKNSQSQS